MPELPPALSGIVVTVVASCLYAAIWRAARCLDGAARVLARAAPAVVIVPGVLYISVALWNLRDAVEAVSVAHPRAADTAARPAPAETVAEKARTAAGAGVRSVAPSVPSSVAAAAAKTGDAAAAPSPPPGESGAWDIVPVLYGTDRRRQRAPRVGHKRIAYGSDRARRLELGQALVTVPAVHRVPVIERPFALRVPYLNVVLYEEAEDPRQHFTVKEVQVLSREAFLALARARLATSRAFEDQALVFVHGFNTGFDEALYRTAQIAYDLQFDGPAFLYSWPAGSALIGYARDRESATQAEPYLKEFLALVVAQTGAKRVSVIAHSMGNLPLLDALRHLGPSLPPDVRLNELILAAPDVDRDVFANLIAAVKGYGRGITLYCSANDRAMIASRQVAGGVPRAGDVPDDGPVIVPGVDTIDVSETSTDLLALNHSSYAERSALLNDIGLLLHSGERPPGRRVPILRRVHTVRGDFWRFP